MNLRENERNSISITKDAKNNYKWDIKLYFDNNEEETIKRLSDINTKLKEEFNKD